MSEEKSRTRSVLRFIVGCLIIVLITLVGKVYDTVSGTLEGFWVSYQSPYDIYYEFMINKLLIAHRDEIHFLTLGLADSWAEQTHKNLVDSVKNKILHDDDAWIEYWYYSEAKLWEHDDKEHAQERIPIALKYMDLLKNGNSKVVQ